MKIKLLSFALIALLCSCDLSESIVGSELQQYKIDLIKSVDISVSEPSDLALTKDRKYLYTVSDGTGEIYKLKLNGDLLRTIKLKETLDLEGICCDPDTNFLWLTEEQNRELLKINLQGEIVFRKKILDGSDNSGLEGICFGKNNNLILIKEKNPAWFLELDSAFSIIYQETLEHEPDYAAITWSRKMGKYLMISQQGSKLLFFLPQEELFQSIDLPMNHAEGIAFDEVSNTLYIVDDNEAKLYYFTISENL